MISVLGSTRGGGREQREERRTIVVTIQDDRKNDKEASGGLNKRSSRGGQGSFRWRAVLTSELIYVALSAAPGTHFHLFGCANLVHGGCRTGIVRCEEIGIDGVRRAKGLFQRGLRSR
jgi:hypothetical protein